MFPSIPPVTRTLIGICIAVFVVEFGTGTALATEFALWPISAGMPGFQPWQLVTYSFLHGSPTHLFFNMFALYMFGSDVERVVGPRRFTALYFLAVVSAGVAQLAIAGLLEGNPYPTIGASGGIFGLLLAYASYFPTRTVVLLFPPIPMSARTFAIAYGALELFFGVSGTFGGVAHFAHLGGMVGAWLMIAYWRGRFPFRRQR
jgi:membrane associated rhomboid family serine protease